MVSMVIEIDRKKNGEYRKRTLITVAFYLFATAVFIGGALAVIGRNWPLLSIIIASYTAVMVMFASMFRRAFKFRRTDHHLFLDQTGLAIVDGHARVDIPWSDIEKIMLSKIYVANINISRYILVKLRPDRKKRS